MPAPPAELRPPLPGRDADARATTRHARPRRAAELTPPALADALRADPRLILPVGAFAVRWAHLPAAAHTLVVDRLADDLSARCGVLRAPTVNYGSTPAAGRGALGSTSVRKKTLHRLLNDLLSEWEAHGVDEFVLLTTYQHDPHLEALATVVTARARVRVVDALAVDCSDLLGAPAGPARAEELATSLVLHLAPDLVRAGAADPDNIAERTRASAAGGSAATGAAVYARVLDRVAHRVLGVPVGAAA